MWLVLCHADDLAALWAYHGLKERRLAPLELVTAEALSYALRLEHRVGAAGSAVELELADGRRIVGSEVRGVLNRLWAPVLDHWRQATEKDREYVLQESYALLGSWLYGLPGRVLNPATAAGLCGAHRPDMVWAQMAARAGLATRSYRHASFSCDAAPAPPGAGPRRTLFVVGGAVAGSAPAGVVRACGRLSELAASPLLAVEFEATAMDEWTFAGASPIPDLRRGGPPVLDALEEALR